MATFKRPEDVDAYRLALELRDRVYALTAKPAVARHFRFCDQIRDSGRSAPANLSEGLGRYKPRDNARFVRNALGSLNETLTHLDEAIKEKYIEGKDYQELSTLAERAIKISKGWHNYLVNCPTKPTSERQNPGPRSRTKNPQPKNTKKEPATKDPERRKTERRTAERRQGERRNGERRRADRRT